MKIFIFFPQFYRTGGDEESSHSSWFFSFMGLVEAQVERSIDAIAIWGEIENGKGKIYYSFRGHKPKIPIPVGNITDWKWWSLQGENVATERG